MHAPLVTAVLWLAAGLCFLAEHYGVDLTSIRTYATVRDGLRYCMAAR